MSDGHAKSQGHTYISLLYIHAYIIMYNKIVASYCVFIITLVKSKVFKSNKKFVDSTSYELQKKYFDSEVSLTYKIIWSA